MRYLTFVSLIGFVVLGWLIGTVRADDTPVAASAPRIIQVSGNAEIKVVPDEIRIAFGVYTWRRELQSARQEHADVLKRVFAKLQALGLDSKQIQTDYMSIQPQYDSYSYYEHQDPTGYTVSQNVTVILKDVSKFEAVQAGILESGIDQISGIDFHTTELRKHRDEARVLAVRAAQEKAAAMAKELGQTIGDPLRIEEEQSTSLGWYNWWWGGGQTSQNVVQNAGNSSPSLDGSVALGQISVNASVTVEFILK